jgi:transcriptional regulator with XRE-family HTH domain
MNLKSLLKKQLETKGITASQLSRMSGVPKQSISGWLSGSNPRDIRQLKKAADSLGVTVDQLCFGESLNPSDGEKTCLDSDKWISGLFEVKLRRIK